MSVQRLALELFLARAEVRLEDAFLRAVEVLAAMRAELASMPPLGVAWDVALCFAPWLAVASVEARAVPADEACLRALMRVDAALLGPLANDPARALSTDAMREKAARPRDVAAVVATYLGGFALRRDEVDEEDWAQFIKLPFASFLAAAAEGLEDAALVRALAADLTHTVEAAPAHVDEGTLLIARHTAELASEASRRVLRQLGPVIEAMDASLPKRLSTFARKQGTHPTKLQQASTFPAGGLSEIGPLGSLESLVPSELVLMEDGPPPDLFSVRWASGELLYYQRDESLALRRPYRVVISLAAELAEARVKDASMPAQRLVVLLASIVVMVRRLIDALREEALKVDVVFPEGALEDEARWMAMVLPDDLPRGVLDVRTRSEVSERALLEEGTQEGDVTRIQFVLTATEPLALPHVRGLACIVSDATMATMQTWRAHVAEVLRAALR
jgi:hypothetical protein